MKAQCHGKGAYWGLARASSPYCYAPPPRTQPLGKKAQADRDAEDDWADFGSLIIRTHSGSRQRLPEGASAALPFLS